MPDGTWWLDPSELDKNEQLPIIDLSLTDNFLVTGPPGSGKTNLLLLRAQHMVNSGRPNVAVLMFTKTLKRFAMQGGAVYSFSDDKVQTFHAWQNTILREHGLGITWSSNFDADRAELSKRLAALFDATPALQHQLECVFVDEVQDATIEEVDLFFRAAKNVFFVGDHRQMIWASNGVLEEIEKRVTPRNHRKLIHHWRNGRKICEVADAIGVQMGADPVLPTANYKEAQNPSSVDFEPCVDTAEQTSKLIARLQSQLAAFPDELLGVACPKKVQVDALRAELLQSAIADHVCHEDELRDPFRPEARIFVTTIHDAKGLEFRTMHLASMESVKKFQDRQKRMSYTAVTRAKTGLSIYWTSNLPPHLEQARAAVSPRPATPPNVNALFPGRKA